jgi:hypothetical protein
MFTRAVFYLLRDVAAQLGSSSDARLRYSESALELEYAVPRLQQLRAPLDRRISLFPILALLGVLLWLFGRHDTFTLVMLILFGIGWVVQTCFKTTRPRADIKFVGRVRITLNTARPVFQFETLTPVGGPPPAHRRGAARSGYPRYPAADCIFP